jgi:hypothetical protein
VDYSLRHPLPATGKTSFCFEARLSLCQSEWYMITMIRINAEQLSSCFAAPAALSHNQAVIDPHISMPCDFASADVICILGVTNKM